MFFYCLSITFFPFSPFLLFWFIIIIFTLLLSLFFCGSVKGEAVLTSGWSHRGALPELGHLDPDVSAGGTWDLRKIENTTLQEHSFNVQNKSINFSEYANRTNPLHALFPISYNIDELWLIYWQCESPLLVEIPNSKSRSLSSRTQFVPACYPRSSCLRKTLTSEVRSMRNLCLSVVRSHFAFFR